MSLENPTYGGRLYAELRRLSGYDLVTSIMDYKTIQQLKKSDRESTLKLFRGNSYELVQLLKTAEPEEVGNYLVEKWEEANQAAEANPASLIFIVSSIGRLQSLGRPVGKRERSRRNCASTWGLRLAPQGF